MALRETSVTVYILYDDSETSEEQVQQDFIAAVRENDVIKLNVTEHGRYASERKIKINYFPVQPDDSN